MIKFSNHFDHNLFDMRGYIGLIIINTLKNTLWNKKRIIHNIPSKYKRGTKKNINLYF
jgi:hypothetical protein